ncbi:unnamed protein product [Mytilus coruscus]|uniref:Uncharacterized protein n=1 Tax=Mytilus coruscus TaxID=42192 RepID=A0A6J8B8M6_MYTCO|nr:unnamed protein product [Mytilus coruscus]
MSTLDEIVTSCSNMKIEQHATQEVAERSSPLEAPFLHTASNRHLRFAEGVQSSTGNWKVTREALSNRRRPQKKPLPLVVETSPITATIHEKENPDHIYNPLSDFDTSPITPITCHHHQQQDPSQDPLADNYNTPDDVAAPSRAQCPCHDDNEIDIDNTPEDVAGDAAPQFPGPEDTANDTNIDQPTPDDKEQPFDQNHPEDPVCDNYQPTPDDKEQPCDQNHPEDPVCDSYIHSFKIEHNLYNLSDDGDQWRPLPNDDDTHTLNTSMDTMHISEVADSDHQTENTLKDVAGDVPPHSPCPEDKAKDTDVANTPEDVSGDATPQFSGPEDTDNDTDIDDVTDIPKPKTMVVTAELHQPYDSSLKRKLPVIQPSSFKKTINLDSDIENIIEDEVEEILSSGDEFKVTMEDLRQLKQDRLEDAEIPSKRHSQKTLSDRSTGSKKSVGTTQSHTCAKNFFLDTLSKESMDGLNKIGQAAGEFDINIEPWMVGFYLSGDRYSFLHNMLEEASRQALTNGERLEVRNCLMTLLILTNAKRAGNFTHLTKQQVVQAKSQKGEDGIIREDNRWVNKDDSSPESCSSSSLKKEDVVEKRDAVKTANSGKGLLILDEEAKDKRRVKKEETVLVGLLKKQTGDIQMFPEVSYTFSNRTPTQEDNSSAKGFVVRTVAESEAVSARTDVPAVAVDDLVDDPTEADEPVRGSKRIAATKKYKGDTQDDDRQSIWHRPQGNDDPVPPDSSQVLVIHSADEAGCSGSGEDRNPALYGQPPPPGRQSEACYPAGIKTAWLEISLFLAGDNVFRHLSLGSERLTTLPETMKTVTAWLKEDVSSGVVSHARGEDILDLDPAHVAEYLQGARPARAADILTKAERGEQLSRAERREDRLRGRTRESTRRMVTIIEDPSTGLVHGTDAKHIIFTDGLPKVVVRDSPAVTILRSRCEWRATMMPTSQLRTWGLTTEKPTTREEPTFDPGMNRKKEIVQESERGIIFKDINEISRAVRKHTILRDDVWERLAWLPRELTFLRPLSLGGWPQSEKLGRRIKRGSSGRWSRKQLGGLERTGPAAFPAGQRVTNTGDGPRMEFPIELKMEVDT